MNKDVFEHLQDLHLVGSINMIQTDLFYHFKEMKIISLVIDDLKAFFHNSVNGTEWLEYINNDLHITNFEREFFIRQFQRVALVQFVESQSPFVQPYSYPENDYCLFNRFPHHQLIYPIIIMFKQNVECSCTLVWLINNSTYYFNDDFSSLKLNIQIHQDFENFTLKNCFKNLTALLLACNFTQKSKDCKNETQINTKRQSNPNGVFTHYIIFLWLKYIIKVYFHQIRYYSFV